VADVRHLMLIVGNILDNAIRYTPMGGKISVVTEVLGRVHESKSSTKVLV